MTLSNESSDRVRNPPARVEIVGCTIRYNPASQNIFEQLFLKFSGFETAANLRFEHNYLVPDDTLPPGVLVIEPRTGEGP